MSVDVQAGDRIELLDMPNDPAPIIPGAKGIVRGVHDLKFAECMQVEVDWDDGRKLCLVSPPDLFRILERAIDA